MSTLPHITDIIKFIETELADIRKQSKWDFSGIQVFTNDRVVSKVAFSLDVNKNIVNKAINSGCELLITHHPLFFRETKGIISNRKQDELAITAIKGGLDILSYHTNIDIAENGTSRYICELIGGDIQDGFLSYEGSIQLYKIAVFVPYDNRDEVFDAMTAAGAGKAPNYEGCGYMSEGVGMFTPLEGANPHIGNIGEQAIVDEVKLETVVDEKYLKQTIKAMVAAHPYEVPAYEVIKLENSAKYGFGKVAKLNKKYNLNEFIAHVKSNLKIDTLRTNIDSISDFDTYAVCTGSGASVWRDCLSNGVNVLITGDMKYHDAVDAMEAGICIIDAGHQATEEIYMAKFAEILKNKFNIEVILEDKSQKIFTWG